MTLAILTPTLPQVPAGIPDDLREVEFKSRIPFEFAAAIQTALITGSNNALLQGLREAGLLPRHEEARVSLQHTYYDDTSDCELARQGLSLRSRIQAQDCSTVKGIKDCKPTSAVQDRYENEGRLNVFTAALPRIENDTVLQKNIYNAFIELMVRAGVSQKSFSKKFKPTHGEWLVEACRFLAGESFATQLRSPYTKKSLQFPAKLVHHCLTRAVIKHGNLTDGTTIRRYGGNHPNPTAIEKSAQRADRSEVKIMGHDEFVRAFIHIIYKGTTYELAIDFGQSQKGRFLQSEFEIEAKPTTGQIPKREELDEVTAIVVKIFKDIAPEILERELCDACDLTPSPSKGEINALGRRAVYYGEQRCKDRLLPIAAASKPNKIHQTVQQRFDEMYRLASAHSGLSFAA